MTEIETELRLAELRMHARDGRVRTLVRLRIVDQPANLLVGDAGAREIAAMALDALRSLTIIYQQIGDDGARALASGSMPRLESLDLVNNRIGTTGARALAAGTVLGTLRALDLSGNPIGDAGAGALAGSPAARGLRVLGLAATHLGPAGAVAIASSPYLGGLEELRLSSCPIGDDGVIALLALGGLRRLAIVGVGAGDRAAHAIADASHLVSVELANNLFGRVGVRALRTARSAAVRTAATGLAPRYDDTVHAPTRARSEAFEVTRGAASVELAMRALTQGGIVAADPRRTFAHERFEICTSCFGTGTDWSAGSCYACSHHGRNLVALSFEALPETAAQLARWAADAPIVVAVEEQARELARRLAPWGATCGDAIEWHLRSDGRAGSRVHPLPPFLPALVDLRRVLDEPSIPTGPFAGWAAYGHDAWRDAAARGIDPFATRTNPFEPLLAIQNAGYSIDAIGGEGIRVSVVG